MQQDSLVRFRQLNSPEISGFIDAVISGYLYRHNIGTDIDTGAFLMLVLNLSGYVTSGDITGFATKLELSGNNLNLLSQIAATYYPLSNPSGFSSQSSNDARYVRSQGVTNDTNVVIHDSGANKYPFYFVQGSGTKLEGNNSLIRLYSSSASPLISGFNISGLDIVANTLNGQPVLSSGAVVGNFVPLSKFTAGSAGNGFQYELLLDTVRSKRFIFEQNAHFYMEGQHAINVGNNYIIDLYGSRAATYSLQSGAPYILGFDIYAGILQSSGSPVITSRDISNSGFVSFSQLTGTSGTLSNADSSISTRLVNTGSFLFGLLTGVSGSIPNNQGFVVKTTGSQTISGAKTFTQGITVPSIIDANTANWFQLNNNLFYATGIWLNVDFGNRILYKPTDSFGGTTGTFYWGDQILSGTWQAQNLNVRSISINGSGVPDFSKVVFATGDQTIGGNKTFTNNVSVNGILFPESMQTPDVLSEGTIYDLTGQASLKWERRRLYNASGTETVDWHDKVLTGGQWHIQSIDTNALTLSGVPILTTPQNVVFITGTQTISGIKSFSGVFIPIISGTTTNSGYINVNTSTLTDNFAIPSLNWNSRAAQDDGGIDSIEWGGRLLLSDTANPTVDWNIRAMYGTWDADGLTISGGHRIITGFYTAYTGVSGATGPISAYNLISGTSSSNLVARALSGASGVYLSQDASRGYIIVATTGLVFTFQTGSFITTGQTGAFGGGGTGSANLTNVVFTTGNQTISGVKSFGDGIKLRFISGLSSSNAIDLNGGLLNDSSNVTAVDWPDRTLVDTSTAISLDWSQRLLNNSSSIETLDWDSSILRGSWDSEGLTIFARPVITGFYSAYTGLSGASGAITAYSVTSGQVGNNLVLRAISGSTGINISKDSGNGYLILTTSGVVFSNQTGSFITTANTGGFVDTAHTGGFVDTAHTGSFVDSAHTGGFVDTAHTGSFITTGQTGQFYSSSNPSGFITSAQAAGVNSLTVNGTTLSGSLTLIGVSGIGLYTGNSSKIYWDGAGLVNTSGATQIISGSKFFTSQMAVSGVDGGFNIGANGLAINQVPVSGLGAGVVMATTDTTLSQAWQFFVKGSTKHFFVGRSNIRDNILFDGNSSMIFFPGGNAGASLPTTTGTVFISCGTANQTALIVRGKSALTTDLTQWRDTNDNNLIRISPSGLTAFGAHTPTAVVHLKAGGSGTGTAPLKFIGGSLLTTGEPGSMEFDGTNWFVTDSTSGRYMLIHSGVTGRFLDGSSVGGVRTISISGTSFSGNLFLTGARAITVKTSGQTIFVSGAIMPAVNLQSGTSVVIDWRSGDLFYHSLTGNTTFSFTGDSDGQQINVAVTQTGTTAFSVTWATGGNFKWFNGNPPIQSTDSSSGKAYTDLYTFYRFGIMTIGKATQSFFA